MKRDFLSKIEKLNKTEMFKIRGGKEKPKTEDDILIIRKRKSYWIE
jgi:hypothetical protein